MKIHFSIAFAASLLLACNGAENQFDASGAFEAEETVISAEATGTIRQLDVEEGQQLAAGQTVGYIDSTQLYLKKKQLEAQIAAVLGKRPDIAAQVAALQEQLKAAETERTRITNLVNASAAPKKQLDDINAQIEVLQKQIAAQRSALGITSSSISQEGTALQVQIEQVNDQLAKCRLVNPVQGTVLAQYTKVNEVATPGKPLYKIADLSTIVLRAYITGDQLPQVKLNQKVKVLVDIGDGEYATHEGVITWISDKAEFTPKTIQTKEERTNLVYAVKIDVKNNGSLKIGMYGEVKF